MARMVNVIGLPDEIDLYIEGELYTGQYIENGQSSGYHPFHIKGVLNTEGEILSIEYEITGNSLIHTLPIAPDGQSFEGDTVAVGGSSRNNVLTLYIELDVPEPEPEIVVVEEVVTESIPFNTIITEDDTLEIGEEIVTQQGVSGERTITYEVTYTDGVETDRVEISSVVTIEPVDELVTVGTKEPEEPEEPEEYVILQLEPNPSEMLNPNYFIRVDGDVVHYDTDTMSYPPIPIIKGTQVEIRLTAKSTRLLPSEITVFERDNLGDWRGVHTFNTDRLTGGFLVTMNGDKNIRFDFLTEIAPRPDVEEFPFIKIYEIERENLELLTTLEFEDTQNSGYWLVTKGGSEYMMALYRVPFIIEGDETQNVLLGEFETDIPAQSIGTHVYSIDLGKIQVGMEVWGGVAYSNVTIELFAPYFQKIVLDVDEVLMNTLNLNIELNLLNGTGTLNVHSEKTNSVIYSESKQISQYIPYIMGDTIKSEMGTDVLENTITKPYVEVKKEIPDNEIHFEFLNRVEIDENTALVKSDNLYLTNTSATIKEQEEIKRLISEGVFIDV